MWLLDTADLTLHFVHNPEGVSYAILSHLWSVGGEQSFQDLQAIHAQAEHLKDADPVAFFELLRQKVSFKIQKCCEVARAAGYAYVWIDTCCINHSSSSELSEAINSMYAWYARAEVCYAYLHDVPDDEDPLAAGSSFRRSRWFSRGWTLQELIAPRNVIFLSSDWTFLGTKGTLSGAIEFVTGISRKVLDHSVTLDTVSVATRMSWASQRRTTRLEDEAYSLMGLFGVHMPTMYGEGRNAFLRLQEEILKRIPDQSIFVWGPHSGFRVADILTYSRADDAANLPYHDSRHLLADSPAAFAYSAGVKALSLDLFSAGMRLCDIPPPEYTVTAHGIRTTLPITPIRHSDGKLFLAILACHREFTTAYMALVLYKCGSTKIPHFRVGTGGLGDNVFRITQFNPEVSHRWTEQVTVEDVLLIASPRRGLEIGNTRGAAGLPPSIVTDWSPRPSAVKLVSPKYMRLQVHALGYSLTGPETHQFKASFFKDSEPFFLCFVNAGADPGLRRLTIRIDRCRCSSRILVASALFHDHDPGLRLQFCHGDHHVAGWPGPSSTFQDPRRQYTLQLDFRSDGEYEVDASAEPLVLLGIRLERIPALDLWKPT
ncbi:HET-domain-containing protein [Trametes sanguinea]|nr:HET-domain-containing protein [Trametes sanguinea]